MKKTILIMFSLFSIYSYANNSVTLVKSNNGISDNEIGYWSLWTDKEGISHQSLCKIDSLTFQ